MNLEVLNRQQAPEQARELLDQAESKYGFVPNILGVMANAPALLEAYMSLSQIFEKTSFSAAEKQTVLLAVSAENDCGYCKSAHTAPGSTRCLNSPAPWSKSVAIRPTTSCRRSSTPVSAKPRSRK